VGSLLAQKNTAIQGRNEVR